MLNTRCTSPASTASTSFTTTPSYDLGRVQEVSEQFYLYEALPENQLWDWSISELYGVVIGMFRRLRIFPDTMPVTEGALLAFLEDVRAGYFDNPYHSFAHGVDVASVVYNFLHMPRTMVWLTPLDRLSMMLAALCHDIGHPGLTNLYQVNAKTELAQRYNNVSVLERYSCDLTKELLKKHDLLKWIPQRFTEQEEPIDSESLTGPNTPSDYIHRRIDEAILYTDMKYHFDLLGQLHQLVDELHGYTTDDASSGRGGQLSDAEEVDEDEAAVDAAMSANADNHSVHSTGSSDHSCNSCDSHDSDSMLDRVLPERQRSVLCSILLHAADISNIARPWVVSKWWSQSINAEFRKQSIREREEGLPLSPGLDRPEDEQMAGNIEFSELVRPFYVGLAELIPDMRVYLHNMDTNVNKLREIVNAKRTPAPRPLRRLGERRVSLAAGHLLVPADWQSRLIRRRNTLSHMMTRKSSMRGTHMCRTTGLSVQPQRLGLLAPIPASPVHSRNGEDSGGGGGSSDGASPIDTSKLDPMSPIDTMTFPGKSQIEQFSKDLARSTLLRSNSHLELRSHYMRRDNSNGLSGLVRPSADLSYRALYADRLLEQHDPASFLASLSDQMQVNNDYVMQTYKMDTLGETKMNTEVVTRTESPSSEDDTTVDSSTDNHADDNTLPAPVALAATKAAPLQIMSCPTTPTQDTIPLSVHSLTPLIGTSSESVRTAQPQVHHDVESRFSVVRSTSPIIQNIEDALTDRKLLYEGSEPLINSLLGAHENDVPPLPDYDMSSVS
jgi:hypothetical protein